jgi:hypothetical protein
MKSEETILFANDGAFVNECEIRNPDGSRLKIKLRGGLLVVRVLDRGSQNNPSMRSSFVVSPHNPTPTTDPTLILVTDPPLRGRTASVSVRVQVTWSFTLLVSVRLRSIIGDLLEEYVEKRRRLNKIEAFVWLFSQALLSLLPIVWQMIRYDVSSGWSAWRLWRSA